MADAAQGLPALFRPRKTTSYPWRENGTWQHINHALMMAAREAEGREANPTAGVIDSESVKTTKSGGPRGYDARKKVKGRKNKPRRRHGLAARRSSSTAPAPNTATAASL